MIAVRLPSTIETRLSNLARRTGRTKTFYVREAILQHLEDLEDLYSANRVAKRIKQGKEKTYSLNEVIEELDLED